MSGGIAAYKSAEIVRELIRAHAHVRVVMTRSAKDSLLLLLHFKHYLATPFYPMSLNMPNLPMEWTILS